MFIIVIMISCRVMLVSDWSRHSIAKTSVFAIEILNASNDVIWHQKILMLNFYSTYESLSNFFTDMNYITHQRFFVHRLYMLYQTGTDPLISSCTWYLLCTWWLSSWILHREVCQRGLGRDGLNFGSKLIVVWGTDYFLRQLIPFPNCLGYRNGWR